MRRCKGKYCSDATGVYKDFEIGRFHCWGNDSKNETTITVGIVELTDGTVVKVLPTHLFFLDGTWN